MPSDGEGNFIMPEVFKMEGNGEVIQMIETTGNPATGGSAPTKVFLADSVGWKFGVGDDMYFTFEAPHDCKDPCAMTFDVHFYSPNTTASRFVRFQVDWSAIALGEAVDAAGSSGTLDSGDVELSTTANALTEATVGTIPSGSTADGDHITLKLSRIASAGTAPAAADNPVVIHFEIEYTMDKLGT